MVGLIRGMNPGLSQFYQFIDWINKEMAVTLQYYSAVSNADVLDFTTK